MLHSSTEETATLTLGDTSWFTPGILRSRYPVPLAVTQHTGSNSPQMGEGPNEGAGIPISTIPQLYYTKQSYNIINVFKICPGSSSRLRCLQKRYIIAIMVSLGIIIQFLIKASMSVAIVAMVRPTALTISDNNSTNERTTDTCPITETLSNSSSTQVGEFEWSSTLQGFILSAFYYGYITTQIIGGRLGEKYGAKFIMGPGLLAAGIMSLLTPIAARYHVAAFAVVRILTDSRPPLPPLHLLTHSSFYYCNKKKQTASLGGSNKLIHVSNILSMSLSGVLANISWDLVFYIYGALAVVWVIPWLILVHSSPTQHPTITEEEKLYIMKDRMSFDGEIVVSALGSGLCLLLITLVGCNSTAIVALLVITMFFQGSYCGGSNVNVLNLGPNYAGSITGISLTISNTMGILSAQIDGILIEGNCFHWLHTLILTVTITSSHREMEKASRKEYTISVFGRPLWQRYISTVHPTEIRTSISPSSRVELNTTSALANYATEAGSDLGL
uniref:Sialin n=1 Tax=Timema genevievae TaxID=629358 RepID=A0A7R9JPJ1_TIMGE|nr:unnamed protein product [Timema genevievae]